MTIRDVSKVGEAVTAVTRAGANVMSGPDLRVSDRETANHSAYAQAYRAARSRAEAYAEAADLKIDRVLGIYDGGEHGVPEALPAATAAGRADDETPNRRPTSRAVQRGHQHAPRCGSGSISRSATDQAKAPRGLEQLPGVDHVAQPSLAAVAAVAVGVIAPHQLRIALADACRSASSPSPSTPSAALLLGVKRGGGPRSAGRKRAAIASSGSAKSLHAGAGSAPNGGARGSAAPSRQAAAARR